MRNSEVFVVQQRHHNCVLRMRVDAGSSLVNKSVNAYLLRLSCALKSTIATSAVNYEQITSIGDQIASTYTAHFVSIKEQWGAL